MTNKFQILKFLKKIIDHWLLFRSIRVIRLIYLLLLFFLATGYLLLATNLHAQGCPATDFDCQIAELQKEYDSRKDAHEKNITQLSVYRSQLVALQKKLADLDKKLKDTEKQIFAREVELGVQQELLSTRVREMYKRSREMTLLTVLFTSKSVSDFSQGLSIRKSAAQQDWLIVSSTAQKIAILKKDKEALKKSQVSSAGLKEQIDKQEKFLAGEVEKTEAFFSQIKAKQSELLALKAGGFSTSVGDVPPADDPASRPDYNPGFSPAFAAFSFGAPHFQGLSQYGAFGRAKNGQSAEDILHAYYGGIEIKKDYSTGINIRVSGYGTVDLETYVKRIYEMPGSWGDNGGFEALKAQAVAARSYVLASTNNGVNSICATESCQVYKPVNKGGKWDEAASATRGWVLMANGKPFLAKYAASSGGYQDSYSYNGHSTPGFWDTTSDWTHWADGAWEVKGGSPWFYKAWYRTRSGQSCGRQHPWLTQEEFADIANAAIVYSSGGDTSGIFPTDRCLFSQEGWSKDRMAAEADKHGGKVTSVSGVEIIHSQGGYTKSVVLSTNRGGITLTGGTFYKVFNLRAPGAIGVKSSLFNIMRK